MRYKRRPVAEAGGKLPIDDDDEDHVYAIAL